MTLRLSSLVIIIFFSTVHVRTQVQEVVLGEANGRFSASVTGMMVRPGGELLVASSIGLGRSTDRGTTFETIYNETEGVGSVEVLAIAGRGDTLLLSTVVPKMGIGDLIRSTDGGQTWQYASEISMVQRRHEVLFVDSGGVMFAGGTYLFRSLDAGRNWSPTSISTMRNIRTLTSAGNGVLVGATAGEVKRSTDSGTTWDVSMNQSIWSIIRLAGGTLIAAGDSGIFRSTDQAVTWEKRLDSVVVTSVSASYASGVVAGGPGGTVFLSTDDGVTWSHHADVPGDQVSVVQGVDSTLLVGTIGGMWATDDMGLTWREAGRGVVFGRVHGIAARGEREILVIARNRAIYRTFDGALWAQHGNGLPDDSLTQLMTIGNKALVGTAASGLYAASDAESGWSAVGSFTTITALHFIGGQRILAGTPEGLFRSADSGKTWSVVPSGPAGVLSISDGIGDTVFTGASGGSIHMSTDGGLTFSPLQSIPGGDSVLSIQALGNGIVIAGTSATGIVRSSDGGLTWSGSGSGLESARIHSFLDVGLGMVYAATSEGLYVSTSWGSTWAASNPGLALGEINALASDGRGFLYVATESLGVYKSTAPLRPGTGLANRWLSAGSLHDWYSSLGSEIEIGYFPSMQFGLQWPARRPYQDMKVSKGLWIGTENFTDGTGRTFATKVVHAGPRVGGPNESEFIPIDIKAVGKVERPHIVVEGVEQTDEKAVIDYVDSTILGDMEVRTMTNTSIGVTVHRTIRQFARPEYENAVIAEYVFTNSGNTNADPFIEAPGRTLTGVSLYFLHRYAINRSVRYVVNNSSGWGINTMLDARGFPPDIANGAIDPGENDVKAQFAWQGFHDDVAKPAAGPSDFDNIGAPIFDPSLSLGFLPASDTTGRLGGAQFVGIVHLYADQSATNKVAATDQPSTTNRVASDEPITRNNSEFDEVKMAMEYARMTQGHFPRHAWQVVPTGDFSTQNVMANIGEGGPGGWSFGSGYGPYTLGPGESVRIVVAEAANGMTEEESRRIGALYKSGTITTQAKNDSVLTLGKTRLLSTFRKVRALYDAGYALPPLPHPPSSVTFSKESLNVRIAWDPPVPGGSAVRGYEVYRSDNGIGGPYNRVVSADAATSSVLDTLLPFGNGEYFYYAVSVGDTVDGLEPPPAPRTVLRSSPYYTQTTIPILISKPTSVRREEAGQVPLAFELGQNYPNPFNAETRFAFSIPIASDVRVSVFDLLGREVAVIAEGMMSAGVFHASWIADRVASGTYIIRLTARSFEGERWTGTRTIMVLK